MKKLLSCLALIVTLLATAPAAAQPSVAASPRWKPPVANLAALPASGNTIGDTRVALDTFVHYTWDGDSWETAASGGGGSGTVTSIAIAVPSEWTVSGSPITSSGTITIAEATQAANTVYAGPTTGADAAPGFRALVSADVPNNGADTTGNAATATALAANGANCTAGQFPLGVDASGAVESCSTDISGNAATATTATTASALAANGANCSAGQFPLGVDASGAVESCSTDISGNAATATSATTASALAANGANCSAGNYPLGVDASGAAESCTPDDTGTDDQTAAEVPYTPATGTDWVDPDPTTVGGGLDDLAGRLTIEEAKADADTFAGYTASGADSELISGTIGTTNAVVTVNADDDLVEYGAPLIWNVTAATCTGDGNGGALTVDGSNQIVCSADDGGGGGIGGTTGAVDNSIQRADGTGGSTLQNSDLSIEDASGGEVVINSAGGNDVVFTKSGGAHSGAVSAQDFFGYEAGTTKRLKVSGNYGSFIQFSSGGSVQWNSAADLTSGFSDTGLKRLAAGIVGATDGSSGGGAIDIGDPGTRPTCSSTYRGTFWIDEGGAGVADSVAVCAKDGADAYAWRTIY